MPNSRSLLRLLSGPIAAVLVALAAPGLAEDKCNVKAVIGGKAVTMTHCAVALYDGQGVTLYFSDRPFSAEEVKTFQLNSYPTGKDAAGKPRTMMHFAFCPGGGKPVAKAADVKSVETSVEFANEPMLGRQWVFHLPKEKDVLKLEKLSGDLKPGGKLSGRFTGGQTSDGLKYSWAVDFDFTLPMKEAAAGPGCGS
jgi:hypothetical protein